MTSGGGTHHAAPASQSRSRLAGNNEMRLVAKVAHLYHVSGLRQRAIANQLHLSQSRVSRLLRQAEELGVVRTVVVVPDDLFTDIESELEKRFDLRQVWVVDVEPADPGSFDDELGRAAAPLVSPLLQQSAVVGLSAWSRTLQATVDALEPMAGSQVEQVVEMLGDLGRPLEKHQSSAATHRLAELCDAEALSLRVPGLLRHSDVRQALLASDPYALRVLQRLGRLDLALVGIGTLDVPRASTEDVFFSRSQLEELRRSGVVGQVNMRFLDADGQSVGSPLDELVIGGTLEQLASAVESVAVAGGDRKYEAILAVLRGRWVKRLVTDLRTAERLLAGRSVT